MKIRKGFVSNSSSASFLIRTEDLTVEQLQKIQNHCEQVDDAIDIWAISVDEYVHGSTFMDNFDMYHFLQSIGVDMDKVEWGS